MGKRTSRGVDANPRKRLKIVHEAPTSEDIHTTRQLKQLLAFDQDLQKARHGMGVLSCSTFSTTLLLRTKNPEQVCNHSRSSSMGCYQKKAPTTNESRS